MPISEDAAAIIKVVREVEAKITVIQERQARIMLGFPDGDPESHRRYHESIIEWRELRNQMVKSALIQAAKAGGVGAFGWILYAVWQTIKLELLK